MLDYRNVRAGLFLIVAVIAFGVSHPVFGGDQARLSANLPEEALVSPHSYYHFQGVSQREAEALFGSAIAAVYYRDSGEVELLADDYLSTAREWIAWRASRGDEEAAKVAARAGSGFETNLKATAQMSLQSFINRVESFEETKAGQATGEYLVKIPAHKPAHTLPPTTYPAKRKAMVKSEKDYYYIFDDFEGDTWSVWSRSDNTGGQYTWGVRSCDSYWGSYSADAPRGGSQGALLGCSSPYATSIDSYMSFEACQSVAANWKAFLEFEFSGLIDKGGDDGFAVHFKDQGGGLWGWKFYGDWSDWFQLVYNLRQWYKIGDLGANYCNTLSLNFESDGISNTGFGARVDDLYVYYGDTVGSYECGIIADPQSGDAPLTVAFRATTDMYDPDVYWRFGDGGTSEDRDPGYVYSAPGTYRATVGTYDYGSACYASTTITVTQGACTYSISPTSASYGHTGGSGSINVSVSSGCSWSASTSRSWIDITSGSSGSGSGIVAYSLDANTSTSQRSGTIQVAGKTFTVTQSGAPACTYSISPTAASVQSSGGSLSTSVSANSGCSWSAVSDESWISVTGGSSGSGNGTVSLNVDSNPSSSTRTGTVEIADTTFSVTQYGASQPPAGDHTYYAVVAHTPGENDSLWTSSLSLCSFSSAPSGVTLTYRYGNNSSVVRNVTIPAYGILEYDDVTAGLFNVGGKSSGVVTIESATPIIAAVRTYNSGDTGTFGQSLPGVASSRSISESQTGILSPVRRSPLFRTNVGFINTGSTSCTVKLTFRNGNGSQIGSSLTRGLAPGAWKQVNEAIAAAGVGYAEGAYAVVEVMTPGAEVWAYATVIDNSSGDPTALQLEVVE